MNAVALSTDINIITAEINSYKQVAGQAIFEIGRRLKHVKENDLAHGEFGKWLENINISWSTANKFMKIAKELDSNSYSVMNLGWKALYEIATLPEEEREKEHEVPSTGETKTVNEMTVKELREVKKALKEANEEKEKLEKEKKDLDRQYKELASKPPKTIEVEKTVEVYIQDDLEIKRLQNELNNFKSNYKNLENEKETLEKKIASVEKNAEEYQKLKKDLDNLRDRRNDVIAQIENAGTIGKFISKVNNALENDLAPIKYCKAIDELYDSSAVMEALNSIVTKVENWCQEIRSIMENKNFVDVEVIEYDE